MKLAFCHVGFPAAFSLARREALAVHRRHKALLSGTEGLCPGHWRALELTLHEVLLSVFQIKIRDGNLVCFFQVSESHPRLPEVEEHFFHFVFNDKQ